MDNEKYAMVFADVRSKNPLVHHITNYVTVNDAANITLCAGASPVMAHALDEVEEMVSLAGALVLNIGTPDPLQIEAMMLAGRVADSRNIPIILDPVGAGATRYRTEIVRKLMDELDIAVLKGNSGEIGVLAGADAVVRGVDSRGVKGNPAEITKSFAKTKGITVVMSGVADIVSDGSSVIIVENGHPMMGSVSGTGCMAASLTGAFNAVCSDTLTASAAALAVFGVAGEMAGACTSGPGSFKTALFDSLKFLTPEEAGHRMKIRKI
jgi:hydroxyethylthiazole kinase